ncbi:unnamed protein product [Microthlaspi erraticum]|uniref:Uncharacterized protein n=1 Tax=Microthlaspi erraticum TaxID=1685480 RepID=A0A6D2JLF6_9BRAS|nr:unnamed protein product [Microthlaspi erraticum]
MWSWSQEHALGQVLLLPHGVYKELTCEFLASMRYHSTRAIELSWTKDWDGSRTKWNIKEEELQRVWATIADECTLPQGPRLLRSGAQCLDMCTRLLPTPSLQGRHWTINEGEVKLLDMGIKPIISRTRMGKIRGDRTRRELMPLLDQLHLQVTAYNTRHQRGRKLSVGGSSHLSCVQLESMDKRSLLQQLLLPNPELTTVRGENIDFRPPVYTLVGHEGICEEEMSSIELRIELRSS